MLEDYGQEKLVNWLVLIYQFNQWNITIKSLKLFPKLKKEEMKHAYQSEQILMEIFILGKKDTECCLVPTNLSPLLGK